MTHKDAFRE